MDDSVELGRLMAALDWWELNYFGHRWKIGRTRRIIDSTIEKSKIEPLPEFIVRAYEENMTTEIPLPEVAENRGMKQVIDMMTKRDIDYIK